MRDPSKQPVDETVDAGSGEEPEMPAPAASERPVEIGGREGPDPVRYGDWEKNGRCIDF